MRYRSALRVCRVSVLLIFAVGAGAATQGVGSFAIVRRITAPEARQGVAVDEKHFYAIGNRVIGKYDKRTGVLLTRWEPSVSQPIIHLNSGAVIDGKLYCAHSNYPGVPMLSSIEIFDTDDLSHLHSHTFGAFEGSATWIDRYDGSWWVAFANYKGKGGQLGRGPEATSLVRFDSSWNVETRYRFPPEVIERFGTRSNSGGVWGTDGLLYTTGHDAAEIYVLRLPKEGTELELVEIIPAAIEGQGIAWDPTSSGALYAVVKSAGQIVVLQRRRGNESTSIRQHPCASEGHVTGRSRQRWVDGRRRPLRWESSAR